MPTDLTREDIAFARAWLVARAEAGRAAVDVSIMGRALAVAEARLAEPGPDEWRPIATAPRDGTEVEVLAPAYQDLPPIQRRCAWHPDGGFCIDELRSPLWWRPAPAEPSAPVAPDWPTRCAALDADGRIAARKRVAALAAENAKLRERNAAMEDGLRPFAAAAGHALDAFGVSKIVTLAVLDRVAAYFVDWTHYRRARTLLQGGPDAG